MIAYLFLAAVPVALWLGMELIARKDRRRREIERRRRARKGYLSTWGR